MNTVHFLVKPLLDLFERLRVVTMPEMKAALGTRADVTVFRKLSTLPYRSSYSDRGRFYTLDSIAHFDAHGLWCCREACFSQHGTLLETTEAFVQAAPAGYFAHELASQLHVPVKDALRHLVQRGRLHRQRCGDLYLYTAPDRTAEKRSWRSGTSKPRRTRPHQSHCGRRLSYSTVYSMSNNAASTLGWKV